MSLSLEGVEKALSQLRKQVVSVLPAHSASDLKNAMNRWESDSAALRFHLQPDSGLPLLVGIIGGTGTGKSTLVNRLLEGSLSTVSVRRTFTNGALAFVRTLENVPEGWSGLPTEVVQADRLPVRGQTGKLTVAPWQHPLLEAVSLVDTPDVDGEIETHHPEADRVFRWSQGVVFVVTPEKYQMRELWPYYRMARRYSLPSVFLLNKGEAQEVVEDYRKQLEDSGWTTPRVYSIPRDDSSYAPELGLEELRHELPVALKKQVSDPDRGLKNRCFDLASRLRDTILDPLRSERREAQRIASQLQALDAPRPALDVSPLTEQLERRMSERSVLYLMGPKRFLERARQMSSFFLPHRRGARSTELAQLTGRPSKEAAIPDFAQILTDSFATVQARIDDILRSESSSCGWIDRGPQGYASVKVDPAEAGRIAAREIAEMQKWLQDKWDSSPRDTQVLEKLLRFFPGGKTVVKWTESTPYLLVLVCASSKALFGPVDLLVIGGFSLAAWLGEKLSNEVTARAREANYWICKRYSDLVRNQVEDIVRWLGTRVPSQKDLECVDRLLDEMIQAAGLPETEDMEPETDT